MKQTLSSTIEQLNELKKLFESGVLTEEELAIEKGKVLSGHSSALQGDIEPSPCKSAVEPAPNKRSLSESEYKLVFTGAIFAVLLISCVAIYFSVNYFRVDNLDAIAASIYPADDSDQNTYTQEVEEEFFDVISPVEDPTIKMITEYYDTYFDRFENASGKDPWWEQRWNICTNDFRANTEDFDWDVFINGQDLMDNMTVEVSCYQDRGNSYLVNLKSNGRIYTSILWIMQEQKDSSLKLHNMIYQTSGSYRQGKLLIDYPQDANMSALDATSQATPSINYEELEYTIESVD